MTSFVDREETSSDMLAQFSAVVNSRFSGFSATWAFVATWLDVPPYGGGGVRVVVSISIAMHLRLRCTSECVMYVCRKLHK